MEDKRQELERELSALRSDLAAQDEEQAIRDQEREVFVTIIPQNKVQPTMNI